MSTEKQTTMEKEREGEREQLEGAVKKKIGQLTGSESLEESGEAEKARGEAKEHNAKEEGKAKGNAKEMLGKAQTKVGEVIGSEAAKKTGEANRKEGEAQQNAHQS